MPKQTYMHFWIIMVRESTIDPFEPWGKWLQSKGDPMMQIYLTKKDASGQLRFAKSAFGKRNAYLQKIGAIS